MLSEDDRNLVVQGILNIRMRKRREAQDMALN